MGTAEHMEFFAISLTHRSQKNTVAGMRDSMGVWRLPSLGGTSRAQLGRGSLSGQPATRGVPQQPVTECTSSTVVVEVAPLLHVARWKCQDVHHQRPAGGANFRWGTGALLAQIPVGALAVRGGTITLRGGMCPPYRSPTRDSMPACSILWGF